MREMKDSGIPWIGKIPEGWNCARMKQVGKYVNGYAFKPETWSEKGLPIIRIQNLNNVNAAFNYYEGELPEKYIVNKGDLLISWSASLGAYYWEGDVAYLNQHIFKVVFDKSDIIKGFLKYAVEAKLEEMKRKVHGATMQHIVKKDFDNTIIPVPPLSIQRSIVAELDLLHSVISKKKEQLRELDNLAQSLFYQMFGDPITNPMGWEIKKLGEVAENCDYMRKPITASDRIPGNIPYYGASGIVDYVRDYIFDGDYLLVSEDGANLLARSTPIAFSISGKNWVNNHAHVLKFRESYTQLYVQTLINLIDISDIVTGAVQPKLNQAQLNKFPLPLPPLSLQQSFAAKVSAIEAQKQAITQSIQHTEALLAQRMDNYFG